MQVASQSALAVSAAAVVATAAVAVQDPGDETVWHQLLRHHLDHKDPQVAQKAAAGLEGRR
jgi:hypothetical protein